MVASPKGLHPELQATALFQQSVCDFSVKTELANLSYWVWHFFHVSKDVGTLADGYVDSGLWKQQASLNML